jgi:hypothetical protein
MHILARGEKSRHVTAKENQMHACHTALTCHAGIINLSINAGGTLLVGFEGLLLPGTLGVPGQAAAAELHRCSNSQAAETTARCEPKPSTFALLQPPTCAHRNGGVSTMFKKAALVQRAIF